MDIKPASWEDSISSSYRGILQATRSNIQEVFGLPQEFEEGDKVTTEWTIKINDHICTIYDWKRYEEGAPEMDEMYEWHIGGFTEDVVQLVHQAMAVDYVA